MYERPPGSKTYRSRHAINASHLGETHSTPSQHHQHLHLTNQQLRRRRLRRTRCPLHHRWMAAPSGTRLQLLWSLMEPTARGIRRGRHCFNAPSARLGSWGQKRQSRLLHGPRQLSRRGLQQGGGSSGDCCSREATRMAAGMDKMMALVMAWVLAVVAQTAQKL